MARPLTSRKSFRAPARRKLGVLAVLAALTLFPPPAGAEEGGEDAEEPAKSRFSFDAFGTLGLVYSTEDRADFVWLPTRPSGPGHSDRVSPDPDSILGAQVTFRATPKLTAVVQVVAEQTADDGYAPQLEWANVRYAFTPDFGVRIGRVALPAFMASEYRKVSYANPWIRTPVEVYGLVPIFTLDGVEATYRRHAGDWTSTTGVALGRSEAELPGGSGSIEAEKAWNLNTTLQRGGFTGRVAVAGGDVSIDAFAPFFDAFRSFGLEGEAIADRFELDDRRFRFASASVEYDPGRWLSLAEIGWSDTDSALGEKVAGYLTVGYRWGTFTPYATYSRSELLSESSSPGLSLSGLPPELVPMAAGLNAGLDGFLRSSPVQQSLSLGTRWDLSPGVALKLQVDFIDVLGDSPGTFVNRQPGFETGGGARLFSLATVFTF
jgi:hypothetical protein